MTGPDVRAFLARLEAAGVRLALNASGDGLRVMGKGKPSPEVMAEVKAHKPALLAFLRGEDPAKEEAGPAVPAEAPDIEGAEDRAEEAPTSSPSSLSEELPQMEAGQEGQRPTRPALTPEEWAAEAAQPGRCGSCARAVPADPEDGPLMVRCTAPYDAWWPMSPPFSCHIAARCGAYCLPGEDVGRGYRSREAAKTWGTGQTFQRPALRGGQR